MNQHKPEINKTPKIYYLSAVPTFKKDADKTKKLSAMVIEAKCNGKSKMIRHPVTQDQAETLIGLLVDSVQKSTNTFQALMRGEPVALGRHTAEQLAEFGLAFPELENW